MLARPSLVFEHLCFEAKNQAATDWKKLLPDSHSCFASCLLHYPPSTSLFDLTPAPSGSRTPRCLFASIQTFGFSLW